jgi:poly(hydroxyalkanoate) depolymerase family esterase
MRLKGFRILSKGAKPRPANIFRRRSAGGSAASKLVEHRVAGANPGALQMFAYAPDGLPSKAALVVLLHGCGQTAAGYDQGTGWTKLADELGFAVLAPQQVASNNANTCFNWFEPGDSTRDHGEAASIHAMILQCVREHDLDPAQIYVTGLSAGGAMTAAMLAAYPEIFAGGAIIAGLPAGSASNIPEAFRAMHHAPEKSAQEWGDLVRHASAHRGPNPTKWPRVSIWQGDADTIVAPGNGEALALQWTGLHHLAFASGAVTQGENFRRRAWSGKDGRVAVELIEIAGMGHGVPVGDASVDRYGRQGAYFLDAGLSSTARIASFWGFKVPKAVASAERRTGAPASSFAGFQLPSGAAPDLLGGVQSVIRKSLKAAGLMKD